MRNLSSTAKLGAALLAAGAILVAVATAAWHPRDEPKPDAGPITTAVVPVGLASGAVSSGGFT